MTRSPARHACLGIHNLRISKDNKRDVNTCRKGVPMACLPKVTTSGFGMDVSDSTSPEQRDAGAQIRRDLSVLTLRQLVV